MYRSVENIKTDEVKYIWTAIVPFVDRLICDDFPHSATQIRSGLLSGEYLCWIISEYEEIKTFGLYQIDEKSSTITIIGTTGAHRVDDNVLTKIASDEIYQPLTLKFKSGDSNEQKL